nr:uncharacterized protein C6orf132 homolog isoform X2 [Pelodiscus sinensis]|eukprot:XP_014426862.1 uncharacterized protein C6orf132 homolog isoform X2 [Pelodiscus sinensis]
MKKSQGTFSKLFGKKHANTNNTSLYTTNPAWVFSQEITSNGQGGPGDVVELYYEDNPLTRATDSGTATLKPRPRVRPLLTFLPLNAQDTHGVAVPTPSVPDGFEEKATLGLGSQINGNYRMYSSVGDLRSKFFKSEYLDNDIPPPPAMAPPPPPPSMAPPPPPTEIPLPPPCMAPLPPSPLPPTAASPQSMALPVHSSSTLSSPSRLSPPDFVPPAPPLTFVVPPAPPMPPPAPPLLPPAPPMPPPAPPLLPPAPPLPPPASPLLPPAPPLPPPAPPLSPSPISNVISKWRSEIVLNTRQTDARGNTSTASLYITTPPASNQKEESLTKSTPEPHLTFPRSVKIPPATPVRSSSIAMEEKDSCEDNGPISRQPHSRPPLPPSFTIRPAAKAHLAEEAEQKSTLDRQMVTQPMRQITEPTSPKPESEKDVGPKCEPPAAEEKFAVPSPDYSSSDDDWKEPSNLNKLKQELSALLSSSSKREERQVDKPVTPKPTHSITDHASNDKISAAGSKPKPTWKVPQFPVGGESDKTDKVPTNSLSAKENSAGTVFSAPDNKPPNMQANSVMKFRNELEALLSPGKESKPPTGLTNHRHSLSTNKVALNFGSSQTNSGDSTLPTPIANPLPPPAASVEVEKSQEARKTPSALASNKTFENLKPVPGYRQPGHVQKSPDLPQKPKDQLSVPASTSPSSVQPASPQPASGPQTDFSLIQYKTHRTKTRSTDSLTSQTPSQTVEEGPVSANKHESERGTILGSSEKPQVPTEPASASTNAGQEEDILIHPVTGEKVEKGSPMALLLAAKQRAQRSRPTASRQNSYLSKKLSDKRGSSSQSESGSTNFFYRESKPYSFVVVPKTPQKDPPSLSEGKPHDGMVTGEGKPLGFSEPEQRSYRPLDFSSTSEQSRSAHKISAAESPSLAKPERFGTSSLVQGLRESSYSRLQDLCPKPEHHLYPLSSPPSSLPKEKEETGDNLDYEIIPPPPEFSNDADGVKDADSTVAESRGLPEGSQPWEKQQNIRPPSYGYGNSYALPPKTPPDGSARNSGFRQHYPGGRPSVGLPVSSPGSRPLIKKRLYVSEPDSSYTRTSTSSRNVGTPGTYSQNVAGYGSQAAEGMRRVGSTHRNGPSSTQGRRMSLEPPGNTLPYANTVNNAKYQGQNGDSSAASAAVTTSRPVPGNSLHSAPVNTFTVRPGARQPISYTYQGSHR